MTSSDPAAQFESASRQFLDTELALCDTLLDSAAREYARKRPELGDAIVAKVERAFQVIESRLVDAEGRGWELPGVQERLSALRRGLADLDRQAA